MIEKSMARSTIDPEDVRRFSAVADEWWDMRGPFAPLHKFTPVRLELIREWIGDHFSCDEAAARPFAGLRMLDIGCGGGLLSEPLTRLGASMTGIDAEGKTIRTAALHAEEGGLEIDYRVSLAEALAEEMPEAFDAVIASEVIEHVADPSLFATSLAKLVRPGGAVFVTTLNRTGKSLLFGKFAAEYLLRWVPPGTHDWRQFLTPEELRDLLAEAGLTVTERSGIRFDPLADSFSRSSDLAINYAMLAVKPGANG
ncbi:bifunctional 2-polyprenyl-6-hydroxyphenol methylase/3-demethylubiquinol 3-O-methyltransferase UbiG [Nisaea acidiphila]|uniref:Ubiquinone biosynthesis O-methyltransferase n=1 Tax=Nisaea acidiphila TaxID=1862145 RepID=A0A9J7AUL1_9PROT|nr:bifunctional 2-polyprenyl-6-hydroxyphenol methylase/3-demethylubiquinol 3-O-methyltransferase UbiG [Nisaea acidiphila]UUX51419.1 bifunctional 2-polyprenyl-6-hydroxyphenol methylase/3-demethylubiquinol 3-O-methyltransferase UbiG [Nisaea acidiphila]